MCRTGALLQDYRIKSNGRPLRRTGDLEFLKFAPLPVALEEKQYDCIYEVHISVLVTGVDHWSWTAFAFVDTYYKRTSSEASSSGSATNADEDITRNQESPEFYHEQFKSEQVNFDPLTGGEDEAEPPTWTPREYFLKVLRARVKQVNHEWHNTVFRVLQKIEPQVSLDHAYSYDPLRRRGADELPFKTHDDLLSDPHDQKGNAQDQVLNKKSQIFFDKSIRLLQQMSNLITLSLDAWACFMDREVKYFTNLEKPSGPGRHPAPELCIAEINRDIEDLRALLRSLEHQKDHLNALSQKVIHLDDFTRFPHASHTILIPFIRHLSDNPYSQLEKGLQLDNNEIAALQQRNATLITALTISASVSLPLYWRWTIC